MKNFKKILMAFIISIIVAGALSSNIITVTAATTTELSWSEVVEVVEPKYDAVGDFNNGFARVKLNGKYGFINEVGEEIVEPQYDDVWDFENGFAIVKLNGKWGVIQVTYINEVTRGNSIIEFPLNLYQTILAKFGNM